jgi:hypothetical protein
MRTDSGQIELTILTINITLTVHKTLATSNGSAFRVYRMMRSRDGQMKRAALHRSDNHAGLSLQSSTALTAARGQRGEERPHEVHFQCRQTAEGCTTAVLLSAKADEARNTVVLAGGPKDPERTIQKLT